MIPRALIAIIALTLRAGSAAADLPRPSALAGVRVDDRIGNQVPLDLRFSDTTGRRVQLGELFGHGKPILLVMAYVRCRMLCSLVLHGVTDAVQALPLALGRDYEVVTISIDPDEEAASAAAKRAELLRRIGYDDEATWTYLVGAERPIHALADSLGFRYSWDERTEQYAHPAVLYVLTPNGTLSRYFQGVQFDPVELAAALRAASAGVLGGASVAESVLGCFRFDPAARTHREKIDTYYGSEGPRSCRARLDGAVPVPLGTPQEVLVNELLRKILFLPPQASTVARDIDYLHYFVITHDHGRRAGRHAVHALLHHPIPRAQARGRQATARRTAAPSAGGISIWLEVSVISGLLGAVRRLVGDRVPAVRAAR